MVKAVKVLLTVPMQANGENSMDGPSRLARWLEGRRVERERVAALAAAGVSDAAAYEEPGLREKVSLRRIRRRSTMASASSDMSTVLNLNRPKA